MTDIAIHPLLDHAVAIPNIATWFYDEWGEIYSEKTQVAVQRRIETWLTPNQIPTSLVAVQGNHVVGTVALKESELEFPYTPWLAGLYVIPRLRRNGIGALLVDAAEQKAVSLGVGDLYLYTPVSQAFYERLGWSTLEHRRLPNGPVTVMSKRLQPNHSFEKTPRERPREPSRSKRSV